MLRARVYLLAFVCLCTGVQSAKAGWHEFWHRTHLDFQRSVWWPEPFNEIDARATRAPFSAMVHSGWRLQNTLGQHYFHHETHALNEAGERKLYWIITNAPETDRTVFVSQTHQPGDIERRIDSVQQALTRMMPEQPMPAVIPTTEEPRGWPADYIDTIDRKVNSSIPDPRLPSFQAAGSTGGSN